MENQILSPLLVELFKTQAYIRAFALVNMTDVQLVRFHEEYASSLQVLIEEFMGENPSLLSREALFRN